MPLCRLSWFQGRCTVEYSSTRSDDCDLELRQPFVVTFREPPETAGSLLFEALDSNNLPIPYKSFEFVAGQITLQCMLPGSVMRRPMFGSKPYRLRPFRTPGMLYPALVKLNLYGYSACEERIIVGHARTSTLRLKIPDELPPPTPDPPASPEHVGDMALLPREESVLSSHDFSSANPTPGELMQQAADEFILSLRHIAGQPCSRTGQLNHDDHDINIYFCNRCHKSCMCIS